MSQNGNIPTSSSIPASKRSGVETRPTPARAVNLVVQTAFLGDLLLSVPLLKNIKKRWPEHKIILVCRSGIGGLLQQVGLVDLSLEIIKGDAQSYKNVQTELSKFKIENIFCPHESVRTAFFIKGIKAKNKISFSKWWTKFFFNKSVSKPKELPDALRQLYLLQPFDSKLALQINQLDSEDLIKKRNSKLSVVPDWASASIKEFFIQPQDNFEKKYLFLSGNKKVVLLFPGSVWATKRWTPEGFKKVAIELEQKGFQICWMGSKIEESLCEELNASTQSGINLSGQTSLLESCWIISKAALVIGNDSSSSHMASLVDTPVIAIFGPTVLNFGYRPWHSQAYIIETELACRPCGPHGHHQCPIGTHACMKNISAENVLKLADQALG